MNTVEQMVRDLLEQAIKDELVVLNESWEKPDPQYRTSGELAGTVNLLTKFIGDAIAARDARWEAAEGHCIETAERLSEGL